MVRSLWAGCAAIALIFPGAVYASCSNLLPSAMPHGKVRGLTPYDLARLRDIGPPEVSVVEAEDEGLFALSPDRRHVAFQIHRADPERNTYCVAMVVLDLQGETRPRIVDTGGELIFVHYDNRGMADFPTGIVQPITPRWSLDSKSITFLKRVNGRTQVWRALADGTKSAPITHSNTEIRDFRLSRDGRHLIYSITPSLELAYQTIAAEGLAGFHFDDRFSPMSSDRPYPVAPIESQVIVDDLATGAIRRASPVEASSLPTSPIFSSVWRDALGPNGRRASISVPRGTFWASRGRLIADDKRGRPVVCSAEACKNAYHPWWTSAGRVRFFRREGWADGSTAIYEWSPGTGAPRRLYTTDDVLADCEAMGDRLLCLREGSLTPRRLELLDPRTGKRRLLFNPNPEFDYLNLGKSERLHLTNGFGRHSLADLVLPVDYKAGERYPLIVVQYNTRGFLRGGTGDDYPIQAFANRGYAVLSVSRPKMAALDSSHGNALALERGNLAGFDQDKSSLSSIDAGVRLAIARGIADPHRIGITGMSGGATVAAYGLLHSDLFAAAAMTQCCLDQTRSARVGPAAARYFASVGYPKITDRADSFWSQVSLVRNARRIHTPILLQIADREYMSALPTYTALREVNAPIDMFVFPGEYHVKWQPAHRLAIYRRSLDWFDFWLLAKDSKAQNRQRDIKRWEVLRGTPQKPAEN